MSRRITFLALCLLCLFSLAAAAASEPPNPATPPGPGSGAVTNAPAVDLSWLLQPGATSTSQEPASNALFGATPAFTCTTCICRCIQAGGDSLCCSYVCHPIGRNPC
jgi:hypothetical protein